MSESAVGRIDTTKKDLDCPRDKTRMKLVRVDNTHLDECPKCSGRFFDNGEMYGALGLHADPSFWDRPETTASVSEADIHCPRCGGHMSLVKLEYGGENVEIDRCGHCMAIWLDAGEAETIMSIGAKMEPVIAAEQAEAQKALDEMGPVDFNPGLIARFLALFKKD